MVRSALLAGGLLAFALSFDEIVVTTFTSGPGIQTLPQWIFNNMFRPNNLPLVNVVATDGAALDHSGMARATPLRWNLPGRQPLLALGAGGPVGLASHETPA